MFIIGLDLGQSQDYTALAIAEKIDNPAGSVYNVRKLERTRGTSYPSVVKRVAEIRDKLPDVSLALDYTGVGRPVYDMFLDAGLKPVGVLIHGGDRVNHDEGTDIFRVPKRDLIGILKICFQNQLVNEYPMMRISQKLDLAETLKTEILNLKLKIDPVTAHDSYSAWRENEHDDLVLAAGILLWHGENSLPEPTFIPLFPDFGSSTLPDKEFKPQRWSNGDSWSINDGTVTHPPHSSRW